MKDFCEYEKRFSGIQKTSILRLSQVFVIKKGVFVMRNFLEEVRMMEMRTDILHRFSRFLINEDIEDDDIADQHFGIVSLTGVALMPLFMWYGFGLIEKVANVILPFFGIYL